MVQLKRCTKCGQEKPVDQFYKRALSPDGLTYECRPCKKVMDQEYYLRNAEACRERTRETRRKKPWYPRESWLKHNYGLTKEAFLALLVGQDNRCAVCRDVILDAPRKAGVMAACVDHDHETGVVRGLLCSRCNVGLGQFLDSPARLKAAAVYLEAAHGE